MQFSVMMMRPRKGLPKGISKRERKNFIKNDLGVPQFKVGMVRLNVGIESKKAKLAVNTDRQEYGPGDQVEVNIKSEPNAEIILSFADRGVLDLISYRYGSPLKKFYSDWAHGVSIFEGRRYLIRQYNYGPKGPSPGGDSGEGEEEGKGGFDVDSEDGARKNFKYTAYFKAGIKTDSSGNASFKFKLPDNLTTFRMMAAVAANGKYAAQNKEIRVRKALVVQKLLPRFIRQGDKLNLGAVIINQTKKRATFNVGISAALLSPGKSQKKVVIDAGAAKEVSFEARLNGRQYLALKKKNKGEILVSGLISAAPADYSVFAGSGIKKQDGPVAVTGASTCNTFLH